MVGWPQSGGDRHEATESDRGARRAAARAGRGGDGPPALAGRGPKWQPPLTGRARLVLIILAALIGFGTPALTATAASAATTPVYTFTVADLGQGVHEGGELLSDGSISGGGELSIFNGTVIASITGVDWQQAGPDAVTMCFDFQFQKPAVFSRIECLTVPVGGPTKVQLAGIAETLVRVTPVGAGG
jgi:hypothetical protein